jgi:hypothetical protein
VRAALDALEKPTCVKYHRFPRLPRVRADRAWATQQDVWTFAKQVALALAGANQNA